MFGKTAANVDGSIHPPSSHFSLVGSQGSQLPSGETPWTHLHCEGQLELLERALAGMRRHSKRPLTLQGFELGPFVL